MWGVFLGVPLGILQVYGTLKFTQMITSGKKIGKTVWFILADILLLIAVFFLMGSVSTAHLLWMVSAMVGVMIVLSIVIYLKNMKANRR